MKIKPLKTKPNTGKKGKNHALIIGVLAIASVLAFIFRTFYQDIAPLFGVDAGEFRTYSDHVFGFAIAGLLMYLGFAFFVHPVIGIAIGLAGLAVAYVSYLKLRQ